MYKRNYNFLNFKGRSKENGEWVFGTPIKTDSGEIVIIDSGLNRTPIRRETLCQKTNSVDRNFNPVYEGGLVVTEQGLLKKNQIIGCARFGEEPGYLDSTVNVWKIHWTEPMRFQTTNYEIIGNVYDDKFQDDGFLKENWPDDWQRIKHFVEKEENEEE